ncbi:ABC-three component system protein [Lactococcus insecticola]|uniref:ABC-three component systems C-terminal domain-containing protein n=1 Tax=Pseudolactococcus insecticola TaxID=2709158 RepID=A0A6A0B7F7_9LACT|nr:ABC-three component system protein [Lactococcus insecticola]GFH40264.1 hypothetical protein Hs20B_06620 [Lactococcus insecticola]
MLEFNISSYIQILLSNVIQYRQGPLGILILGFLGDREEVNVTIDDKKVSNLVKRKNDVEDALKMASARTEVIADIIKCFESKVVPILNPHTKDDAFETILNCLNVDATVPARKYTEFSNLLNNNEIGKFLALTFLYALNRTNKLAESKPVTDDFPLLDEVGNECPICHKKLTKKVKNVTTRQYGIVEIFPSNLDESTATEFNSFLSPTVKLDSFDNKLALCKNHAESYLAAPELGEYLELAALKKHYSTNYALQQVLAELDLEDEIKDIIESLANLQSVGNLEQLSMNALKIDQKILPENGLLKNSIQVNVLTYYRYIGSLFEEIEDLDIIQSEIKKAFKRLNTGDWNQQEIVDKLAQWILDKTKNPASHIEACRIIISFFIQSCEVFNEIPK